MKEKLILSTTVLCALLAFLTGLVISAEKEKAVRVARVSQLKGTVNDNKGKTLRLYDAVMRGDALNMPAGASVRLIYYRDYHEEELTGPCAAMINDSGSTLSSGDASRRRITRKPYKSDLPENMASRGREIAGGASRMVLMKPAAYPLFPVARTLEIPKKLTFTWQPPREPAPKFYKVTFSRLDGEKVVKIHQEIISAKTYTLPESVTPPEAGKVYLFGVEGYLKDPTELGAELPESRVAASSPPYLFTMPSPDVVKFIGAQEVLLRKLAPGSDAWSSYALFLFSLYLDYGADDRAAKLAKELSRHGVENDLFSTNTHLKGLIECFAK